MDHSKTRKEEDDNIRAKLMRDILSALREGNTKAQLEKILGLPHQEIHDITAELADKGFLTGCS